MTREVGEICCRSALVMRGYREALRELAAAKDRGVFDPRPDLKLVSGG